MRWCWQGHHKTNLDEEPDKIYFVWPTLKFVHLSVNLLFINSQEHPNNLPEAPPKVNDTFFFLWHWQKKVFYITYVYICDVIYLSCTLVSVKCINRCNITWRLNTEESDSVFKYWGILSKSYYLWYWPTAISVI